MHGLFDDDMGVYREEQRQTANTIGNTSTSFTIFSHRIGMKPFVELGFMPERLASGSQNHFLVARQRDAAQRHDQMGGLHSRLCRP